MAEEFVVIACIAVAITYAAWRIRRIIKQHDNPCYGCDGCALKNVQKTESGESAECRKKSAKKIWQ